MIPIKKMIDIISLSLINLSNSKQYLMDKRLKSLIEAYADTFSPTVKFISAIDYIEDKDTLSEFDWYNKDEDIC